MGLFFRSAQQRDEDEQEYYKDLYEMYYGKKKIGRITEDEKFELDCFEDDEFEDDELDDGCKDL